MYCRVLNITVGVYQGEKITTLTLRSPPNSKRNFAVSSSFAHELDNMVVGGVDYALCVHRHYLVPSAQSAVNVCCSAWHYVPDRHLHTCQQCYYFCNVMGLLISYMPNILCTCVVGKENYAPEYQGRVLIFLAIKYHTR